jgi:probable rRNA maturation factor
LEIYSENLLKRFDVDTDTYASIAAVVLEGQVGSEGEASVVFVSDDRIRELNAQYRNVDGSTDVLSFAMSGDEMNRGVIGDVYISLETAERQAAEQGVPLNEEILRLMIHGLLHLTGHTHDGVDDTARMRAFEDDLMEAHLPSLDMKGPA